MRPGYNEAAFLTPKSKPVALLRREGTSDWKDLVTQVQGGKVLVGSEGSKRQVQQDQIGQGDAKTACWNSQSCVHGSPKAVPPMGDTGRGSDKAPLKVPVLW